MRESKTVNGIKTRYIYNGADIVSEIFEDNIYTYYRATELIGYTNNKGDIYYYRQNSHGDVTAILDIQGNEKKTYSYNAYGKETPFILNPMGNQTAILQWRAETEQTHNPFHYCGEYQDRETHLIYLRNRYYDNAIGRFITEDPIRDGLNWYAYCGNNPIMFVDPWGTYYIKDNGDGTYSVHKDTWGLLIARNTVGLFPCGTLIVTGVEKIVGVVGGRSASTITSIAQSMSLGTISSIAEKSGKKLFKYFTKSVSNGITIFNIIQECDTVYMDQIAFNLIDRNNISTYANSVDSLETLMKNAYGFILENEQYFSIKYDGQGTLFEIDNKIANSKDPTKIINQLVARYDTNLLNAMNNGQILFTEEQRQMYLSSYRDVLEGYKERMKTIDNAFSNAVK